MSETFEEHKISPDVLKAMRRPILEVLLGRGAMSVPELAEMEIPLYLWTRAPLSRGEIEVLVESARRQGLVVALGDAQRPDGSLITEPEWTLTERGRSEVSGLTSWLASLSSRAITIVRTVASLTAVFGIGAAARGLRDMPWTLTVLTVVVGYIALALAWSQAKGASSARIAQEWPRFQREYPEAYELIRGLASVWPHAAWTCVAAATAAVAFFGPWDHVLVYLLGGAAGLHYLWIGVRAAGTFEALIPALWRYHSHMREMKQSRGDEQLAFDIPKASRRQPS